MWTIGFLQTPFRRSKVKVLSSCALFPHEMPVGIALKKLLGRKYLNLVSVTEMDNGGHFAAFERPEELAKDIRSSILQMETIRNKV